MEFGVFIQTYVPKWRQEAEPDAEHNALLEDIEVVKAADRYGFKYAWVTEHHFLDEYSHLSANDVVISHLCAKTERIHVGSGIFNPLPTVNHPVKVAERVAMLDHLSGGRFEFGTGRGAGSHEILGFLPGIEDLNGTKEIWEEVIGEFPKMWLQETYEGFEGKFWSLPPRMILPKPYYKPHPAMWYAAGNPSSYAMAAQKGLGVLGFSVQSVTALAPVLEAYKKEIPNAEPIGAFVNDNVMVTTAAWVAEDRDQAYRLGSEARMNYLQSNVFRYHDTFPHPPWVPKWPEVLPDLSPEDVGKAATGGAMLAGDPDDVLEQCRRWEAAGADQVVIGVGPGSHAGTLETLRLLGEHVIPKLDADPVHRTTKFREAAAAAAAAG
ncbi:MAG TPA: LLM class flavin-dependent oxidoreductase [Acidimicrobiales bacterium]|jgi:alkanesulfonate monooxygenase SsuD/methylene tetrahydromethanopterin reductase-like flavin-dependent oxidoreductase (luciferase family)|nr:LLM class flavin-dependent oxidoreductase [Acidimicrobiales bacterium]